MSYVIPIIRVVYVTPIIIMPNATLAIKKVCLGYTSYKSVNAQYDTNFENA